MWLYVYVCAYHLKNWRKGYAIASPKIQVVTWMTHLQTKKLKNNSILWPGSLQRRACLKTSSRDKCTWHGPWWSVYQRNPTVSSRARSPPADPGREKKTFHSKHMQLDVTTEIRSNDQKSVSNPQHAESESPPELKLQTLPCHNPQVPGIQLI